MREERLPCRPLRSWFVSGSAPEGPICPEAVRVVALGAAHVLAAVLLLLPGTIAHLIILLTLTE